MITIIVAYDEDRAIGKNGKIPWHLPEDFKHFKKMTTGNPCIMGRKSWDSLPEMYRPLPNRPNIVVTRNMFDFHEKSIKRQYPHLGDKQKVFSFLDHAPIHVTDSVEEGISFANFAYEDKEIFIIGGGEIYKQVIEKGLANRVVATEVKYRSGGDVFFPRLENYSPVKIEEYEDFRIVDYRPPSKLFSS